MAGAELPYFFNENFPAINSVWHGVLLISAACAGHNENISLLSHEVEYKDRNILDKMYFWGLRKV